MADYANGRLPDKALQQIPGGRLRRGEVAESWIAMRYYIGRKTGVWLRPTGPWSSYRPYAKQQAFYADYVNGKGPLAAVPGTSNHGWGRAVDIPTPSMQAAVRQYGHLFGWGIAGGRLASDAPSEAWHCTFRGGGSKGRIKLWYGRYWVSRKKKA